jgi:hypothetical protein
MYGNSVPLEQGWHSGPAYPLEYRVKTGTRVLLGSLATGTSCGWLLSIWNTLRHDSLQANIPALGLLSVVFAALLYVASYAMFGRLIVRADSIELRKPFSSRLLRRDEIAGTRIQQTRNGAKNLRIVPLRGSALTIDLPFATNGDYDAWVASLPDLDSQDREQAITRIQTDSSLGPDAASRMEKLDLARKAATAGTILAIAVMLWVMFYPQPYTLSIAILALIPWTGLALLAYSKGLIQIDGRRSDPRPNVIAMFFAPPMALVMRTAVDVNILDIEPMILWGCVAGLPLCAGLSYLGWKQRGSFFPLALLFLMFSSIYGVSLVALGDVALDHASPQIFPTKVVNKYLVQGRSVTRYLVLTPWGPMKDQNRIAVSGGQYNAIDAGTIVCMTMHPGTFGLRWTRVVDCDAAGVTATAPL